MKNQGEDPRPALEPQGDLREVEAGLQTAEEIFILCLAHFLPVSRNKEAKEAVVRRGARLRCGEQRVGLEEALDQSEAGAGADFKNLRMGTIRWRSFTPSSLRRSSWANIRIPIQ